MSGLWAWSLRERWVDRRGWGWRLWLPQALIVLSVSALMGALVYAMERGDG